MFTRRTFVLSLLSSGAFIAARKRSLAHVAVNSLLASPKPIVISTWKHGLAANDAAWKVLAVNGHSLDAVEQGVRVPEADPNVTSVGYGGLPDRDGIVTLDACIMDENGNCGSVGAIENIMHPISVARLVMEHTPHVMLVGDGALQFALANGFHKENLLTESSRAAWKKWIQQNNYAPAPVDAVHHDTIGMLALDAAGRLSGACTTSGLAWKYHGRVGDSPIIGAGMYCDGEIGAACATGIGEAVMKICGSHMITERMRAGRTPQEACYDAITRIAHRYPEYRSSQIGFLAMNIAGEIGAHAMTAGFQYAVCVAGANTLHDAPFGA